MTAALRVWWSLRGRTQQESRVPELLSLVAFAVTSAALLVCAAGLRGFLGRAGGSDPDGLLSLYVELAWLACALMVVPVLTLGGVAARLAARRRDARLATLRLTGATSGQVLAITLAEAASQALTGGLVGILGYAALLPVLSRIPFQGRPFSISELWIGVPLALLAVLAVTVLAVVSGVAGLARVVIGPLGVAARTTPRRLSVMRVVIVVVALVGWLVAAGVRRQLGSAVFFTVLVAVVATVNLVGPYLVMLFGMALARVARTAPTLLAARRLVDDPRSTWRAVSAIGLGVIVAGLSTYIASLTTGDASDDLMAADIGTGAILTLTIISVVAATSTGIAQAARVLDQRDEYRALTLAGADPSILHAARNREVAIPLGATVAMAGGLTLALLVPFAGVIGPPLLARFLLAVLAACVLMALALAASRPLVRQVCQSAVGQS